MNFYLASEEATHDAIPFAQAGNGGRFNYYPGPVTYENTYRFHHESLGIKERFSRRTFDRIRRMAVDVANRLTAAGYRARVEDDDVVILGIDIEKMNEWETPLAKIITNAPRQAFRLADAAAAATVEM